MFDVNEMYLLKYKKTFLRVLYRMTLVINKHTLSFDKGYPHLFSVFLVVFTNEHEQNQTGKQSIRFKLYVTGKVNKLFKLERNFN